MNKNPLLLALLIGLPLHADVVSWNLDNNSTVGGDGAGDLPGETALAGVLLSGHWTNSFPTNLTTDLVDDSGNPSSIDIAYGSTNGTFPIDFAHPGQDLDGSWNKEMLNGYLNAGGGGTSTVTLSGIAYTSYDIYVYFSSDVADREGSVSDGTTTYYFRTIGQATTDGDNAILTQTVDETDDVVDDAANYAVFAGLSGPSQTLTVDIPAFGGIAAIQISGELGELPVFSTQPMSQMAAVGSDVTLSAAAPTVPAPDYQWEVSADGSTGWSELSGETGTTLEFLGVDFPDEGYYRCVATNTNGSATSEVAFLDIFYPAPEFFEQPMDTYALEGSTVTLSGDASTYGDVSYQWFKDGELLPGEDDFELELTLVGPADEGEYFLRVFDDIEVDLFADSNVANLFTFTAWSGLVSHDPFSTSAGYVTGLLPLQDPVIVGYDGAWAAADFGDAGPAIEDGSLVYPNGLYLGSSGAKVATEADAGGIAAENSGRAVRNLAPQLVAAGNTSEVRYLSFLYRNGNEGGEAPTVYSTLALYNGDTADGNRNFEMGIADDALGANYFFRVNNLTLGDLSTPLDSSVHLLVVKFDLSDQGASDAVTVWIDPALGSGDPAGGVMIDFLDLEFDRIAFSDYSSNSAAWDEVRWGSSFDSVTLNPSPGDDFASWIGGFDVGGMTGFDEDPDKDGLASGVENYLGTNPGVGNAGVTEVARDGNTVTFQHPQNATPASDVSASYEWSTDLVGFNMDGENVGGTTVSFVASPNTPVAGTTTVTATIEGTVPDQLFVTLKVVQTPQ